MSVRSVDTPTQLPVSSLMQLPYSSSAVFHFMGRPAEDTTVEVGSAHVFRSVGSTSSCPSRYTMMRGGICPLLIYGLKTSNEKIIWLFVWAMQA
jgi:hypothetical protein